MKILKVTGKEDSPVIMVQMTKVEFEQMITVASAARAAALYYGRNEFDDEQLYRIEKFYQAMKNIKVV
jgi:hypothetical protein